VESSREISRLVLVVPLRAGAHEQARALLEKGPPFDLETANLGRHDVFLTREEVIFVFEALEGAPLKLAGEDPALWQAGKEWAALLSGRPRKAEEAFSWQRGPS
jgi:hypothetical protein